MKKGIVAVLLCALGLCFLLTGCGTQTPSASSGSEPKAEGQTDAKGSDSSGTGQTDAKGSDSSDTGQTYDIVIASDEDGLIMECPSSAVAGETVQLTVNPPLDVQLVVCVNGERISAGGMIYEFVMPDRTAEIQVYTEAYPDGGGA